MWTLIVAPDARPEGGATFRGLLSTMRGIGTQGRRAVSSIRQEDKVKQQWECKE